MATRRATTTTSSGVPAKKTAAKKKTAKTTAKKPAAKKTATMTASEKAASTAATPTHAEMLSFLDTRADDARFLAFAQDAQFKRDKKWGNKTLWKVGDPGRGIAFCISQDWIFSVDVDAAWRGPLAVGLAIKQSRSEVHATLGHPVYEGDSVDKFHRDLWCWFVRYSPPGRVVLVSVCPIDIDTGKREPGTPPLE